MTGKQPLDSWTTRETPGYRAGRSRHALGIKACGRIVRWLRVPEHPEPVPRTHRCALRGCERCGPILATANLDAVLATIETMPAVYVARIPLDEWTSQLEDHIGYQRRRQKAGTQFVRRDLSMWGFATHELGDRWKRRSPDQAARLAEYAFRWPGLERVPAPSKVWREYQNDSQNAAENSAADVAKLGSTNGQEDGQAFVLAIGKTGRNERTLAALHELEIERGVCFDASPRSLQTSLMKEAVRRVHSDDEIEEIKEYDEFP